jgi:hypothetical protein
LIVSIFETFFAWHTGMTLCSISTEQRVEQAIQDMNITHLHMTPTLASRVDPKSVPSVKYLLTLGEGLTPHVHQDWAEKELYQAYSANVLTHVCAIYPNVKASTSLQNIGKPLRNTSAMVVADQESFTLLPRGAIGEICFGGDQIGRLLPNSSSSRVGKFIEHHEYGRLYRTGDFGRLLPDGTILLQKRGQANLHDQLIDIDEVDRALLSLTNARESVCMILDSSVLGQSHLAIFWVPSQQSAGPVQIEDVTNNLFKELGTKLPSSSMPSLLVPIDRIPITRSNKTDYSELKRRVEQLKPEELAMFSPKSIFDDTENSFTELEQTISVALSTVTGTEQSNIRQHTSFYRLGLDSLSAVSFSRKLQEAGCGRLAVSTILRHSSIAQLAAVIPPMAGDQPEKVEVHQPTTVFDETFIHQVEGEFSAAAASVQKIYPCTPLQEAMLAAESGDHSAYFNHLLLLVRADAEAMRDAWAQMMQRHEILRTCFRIARPCPGPILKPRLAINLKMSSRRASPSSRAFLLSMAICPTR